MRTFQALYLAVLLAVTHASLVDDIIDAIKNAATCATCHTLFVPLKGLAALGDKPFTNTFKVICKAINVVDDDVCEGAVEQQAPVLAHNFREINPLGQTATKMCDALLGLCQPPKVNAYTVPFPKPAPSVITKPEPGKKAPFQVVHFSDIHIDRQYTVGAEAECTKPICCRHYADQEGKDITKPAGTMGMRNCDTPTTLVHNFLNQIGSNNKFSIFTGDLVEAAVWLVNQEVVTDDINTFNNELATLPKVKVYPVLGNHESAPVNLFPRNTTAESSAQWVFDAVSKGWEPIVGQAAANQAKTHSGSYSVVVPGTNLRIVSINTVYWYKSNFWLYDDNNQFPDPNGMLDFTVQQLQAAEDAGERVWIIAHMPPNRHDTLHDQSHYYDQIIQRYRHIIAGQFYGHSHQDQFGINYSNYNNRTVDTAVSNAWIAPAITPRSNNPGFKVYDVDPDTFEIMDAKVYRADIDDPNFHTSPTWTLSYSARTLYGSMLSSPQHPPTSPLDAGFWHRVTEVFEKNREAFDVYQGLRKGPGGGVEQVVCEDDECWRDTVCELRGMDAQYACGSSKPGLNLRRRAGNGTEIVVTHVHANAECEGLGMSHVFHELPARKDSVDWEAVRAELNAIILPAEAAKRKTAGTTSAQLP